jgi:hypothetical protein
MIMGWREHADHREVKKVCSLSTQQCQRKQGTQNHCYDHEKNA